MASCRLTMEQMEVGDSIVIEDKHRQQVGEPSRQCYRYRLHKPNDFEGAETRSSLAHKITVGAHSPHFLAKEK